MIGLCGGVTLLIVFAAATGKDSEHGNLVCEGRDTYAYLDKGLTRSTLTVTNGSGRVIFVNATAESANRKKRDAEWYCEGGRYKIAMEWEAAVTQSYKCEGTGGTAEVTSSWWTTKEYPVIWTTPNGDAQQFTFADYSRAKQRAQQACMGDALTLKN